MSFAATHTHKYNHTDRARHVVKVACINTQTHTRSETQHQQEDSLRALQKKAIIKIDLLTIDWTASSISTGRSMPYYQPNRALPSITEHYRALQSITEHFSFFFLSLKPLPSLSPLPLQLRHFTFLFKITHFLPKHFPLQINEPDISLPSYRPLGR